MSRRQKQYKLWNQTDHATALITSEDTPELPPQAEYQNVGWTSEQPYDVDPGLCVIINNMDFKHEERLPAEKDEQRLLVLFTSLGFDVKIHQNLKASEMIHKMKSYGRTTHNGVFFLALLSHGTLLNNKEVVLGTDDKPVEVEQLKSFFYARNCPSLREVPKIFLIDACRGDTAENVYIPPPDVVSKSVNQPSRHRHSSLLQLDTQHFLIVYPSTYGNTAFGSVSEGSYLMRTFVEVMKEATADKSLRQIIDQVKEKIRQENVRQTVESISTLSRPYLIKRGTPAENIRQLHQKFCHEIEEWVPVRESTIRNIEETIEELKKHHKNVNISRITGSVTSIVGSIMAITGFALAPVTFGGSLGLSIPGIALAVAGGTTAAGASIADIVIQKTNVKQAQKQLKDDYDRLSTIYALAKAIETEINELKQKCKAVSDSELALIFGEVIVQGFARTSSVGMKVTELALLSVLEIGATALRVGGAAAKGIAAAGIALNVVLIPIDLIEIVRSSVSLRRGSQTTATKKMDGILTQLVEQKKGIGEVLAKQKETLQNSQPRTKQVSKEQVGKQNVNSDSHSRAERKDVDGFSSRPLTGEEEEAEIFKDNFRARRRLSIRQEDEQNDDEYSSRRHLLRRPPSQNRNRARHFTVSL